MHLVSYMKGYDVEKHIWSTFVLQKEFMKDLSIRNFTLPLYCLVFLDVCTVFYFSKESNTFRETKYLAGYFAKPDLLRVE